MDTMNLATGRTPPAETGADRRRRHPQEAEGIFHARASDAAGRIVSSEAVDGWIDSLDADQELPAPRPGQ